MLGIVLGSEFTAMNMSLTPYWSCIVVEYSNGMHIIENVKAVTYYYMLLRKWWGEGHVTCVINMAREGLSEEVKFEQTLHPFS